MRPSIVKIIQRQIKHSERKLLPHSGHVSMIDDPGLMNEVVADFLGRVEVGRRHGSKGFQPRIWEEDDNGSQRKLLPRWAVVVCTAVLAFVVGAIAGKHQKSQSEYSRIGRY